MDFFPSFFLAIATQWSAENLAKNAKMEICSTFVKSTFFKLTNWRFGLCLFLDECRDLFDDF